MFCKDILEQIFVHLSGRDLFSCSIVCKDWNKVSNENIIWFHAIRKDLPKKFKINTHFKIDPRFIYCEDLCYKSLYLCYFDHHYKCGASEYYRDLCCIPSHLGNWFEKIGVFILFSIGGIIFFPAIVGVEIYEFCKAKSKKYEYCDCDQCYKRSIPLLRKYYK